MGLSLAPFNNAMRLGQGFNSYTQEICIDDAVIVDPGRAPNQITNDGTTMLDLRASMRGPSAYTEIGKRYPQDEVPITGQRGGDEKDDDEDPPKEDGGEKKEEPKEDTGEGGDDTKQDKKEDEEEQKSQEGKDEKTEGGGKKDSDEKDTGKKRSDKKPGNKKDTGKKDTDKKPGGKKDSDTGDHKEDPVGETGSDIGSGGEDGGESGDENSDKEGDEEEKKRQEGLKRQKEIKDEKKEKEAAEREKADKKAETKRGPRRDVALTEEEEREKKARKRAQEKFAEEAASLKAYTQEEMDAFLGKKKKKLDSLKDLGDKRERGIYRYNPTGARGPAQIVTYSSRFVEKLSDITDDMNISGALSIKYGTIGGSGRGAFINTEKFQESDLNFYISVKVINQTTNLQDALVYQPLRSVSGANFREVYGDSFISGFIEGGEFNAVVSMKVHNKEKITDIRAQAKVALSVGMASVEADAAVKIAKSNINNNTETTIQVSWSGGGYIKPIDEPWDINSLTDAAGRFPDLVATTPQRIYAILTKYETLRSFLKLKPAAYSTMQYEVAQLYTNMLMDTYMSYKTILKGLATAISDVESNLKTIKPWPGVKKGSKMKTKFNPKNFQDETPFPATLGGLDKARRACRFQMVKIVNEIDEITKDPKLATDEERYEPFQTPREFKERLPIIDRVVPLPAAPLSMVKIGPRTQEQYPPLCDQFDELEEPEKAALKELVHDRPDVSRYFRLTKPIGSVKKGTAFNNVDFLKHGIQLTAVKASTFRGCVCYVGVSYTNGLTVSLGCLRSEHDVFDLELNLNEEEKIIAAIVETGEEQVAASAESVEPRLTKLVLFTNRGNKMTAEAPANPKTKTDSARTFANFDTTLHDPVMENSCVKGFWGYSQNGRAGLSDDGIWRLGIVWGNELEPEPVAAAPPAETKKPETETK